MDDLKELTKGDIWDTFVSQKKKPRPTFDIIKNKTTQVLQLSSFTAYVKALEAKINGLKKNLKRNGDKYELLRQETFCAPEKREKVSVVKNQISSESDPKPIDIPAVNVDTASTTRCCKTVMKVEISNLQSAHSKEIQGYQSKIDKLECDLMRKQITARERVVTLKRLRQSLKRKHEQVVKLKTDIKKLSKCSQKSEASDSVEKLQKQVQKTKNAKAEGIKYQKETKSKLKQQHEEDKLMLASKYLQQIDQLKELVSEYELTNESLKCEIDSFKSEDTLILKVDGKTYAPKLRRCVYFMIENSVPVEHCSAVLRYLLHEFTGRVPDTLPSTKSIRRMITEMNVMSNIQCGKSLIESTDTTLSWDATSIKGAHINEVTVHSNNNDQCHTLSVGEIPGGTAQDYVNHINQSMKAVASDYSKCYQQDEVKVLTNMQKSVSNTLSDRAAVNNCVTRELKKKFENDNINTLHCNVHPLDSLALQTKAALKSTTVNGKCLGHDGGAVNLIQAVSTLRWKAGTGDPGGFKTFFKERGIAMSNFPRYVGNRLNILYISARNILKYKSLLIEYLSEWCTISNSLKTSILEDLNNVDIIRQLQVIAKYEHVVTTPWMKLFYAKSGNQNHLQHVPSMKKCVSFLEALKENPGTLYSTSCDVFGKSLEADDIPYDEACISLLSDIASRFVVVLTRQLAAYLTGELSEPDDKLLEQTSSAPVENMRAERVLGVTDHLKRNVPNGSNCFVNSKVTAKVNKTLPWLDQQADQDIIIQYGIKRGRELQQESIRQDKILHAEKIRRMSSKQQTRLAKTRNKLEKSVKALLLKPSKEEFDTVLDSFNPYLQQEQRDCALKYLEDPSLAENSAILHSWYDRDKVTKTEYNGKIVKFSKKKMNYRICYWSVNGETEEEDGVDYDLKCAAIIADIILEDLIMI